MTLMTSGGGMAMCTAPDVCKTPSPAGPVPIPYPNLCQFTMANGGTCSSKVMGSNMPVACQNTEITLSSGDEAGVSGGVVSSKFIGPCKVQMGSTKVMAQNKGVAYMGTLMGHNGSSPNTVGNVTLASVMTVMAMP